MRQQSYVIKSVFTRLLKVHIKIAVLSRVGKYLWPSLQVILSAGVIVDLITGIVILQIPEVQQIEAGL